MHALKHTQPPGLAAEAAALLVDKRRNRFFTPFLARERSVTEVAAELGVGKSLVSYWVGRMCRLGLLQAVPAAGRRRRYRSTADQFEVPLEEVPLESLEAILDAQMDPDYQRLKASLLHAALRFGSRWQYVVRRTPQGALQSLLPREGTLADAAIANHRCRLSLSPEHAAQLRAELSALSERYIALQREAECSGPRVLLWVAAVAESR
jgi:transposase